MYLNPRFSILAPFSGCNPLIKDINGVPPRQIALDANFKEAAKELKKAEKQYGKRSGLMVIFRDLTLYDWSQAHEKELCRAFVEDCVPIETLISVLEELKAPTDVEHLRKVISVLAETSEGHVNVKDFIKGARYINKQYLHSVYLQQKKKKEPKAGKGKKKGKFVNPFPICVLPPEDMSRRSGGGPPLYMIEKYNPADSNHYTLYHPPLHPVLDDSRWYTDEPDKEFVHINNCVRNGDVRSLDLAFRQGVPVDIHDPLYKTPLMVACAEGCEEVVRYLLSQG